MQKIVYCMSIKPQQRCLKNNRTNGIMSLLWLKFFRASIAQDRSQPSGMAYNICYDRVSCNSSTYILCSYHRKTWSSPKKL